MQIFDKRLDEIKPYENNPRHNEIVEGHGRYEALKQLGYTDIPVIRLDSLSDEQTEAVIVDLCVVTPRAVSCYC